MTKSVIRGVLAIMSASAPWTGASASPPLPIAGKWQLTGSPNACRLTATFGQDRDTVEFTQSDPRGPLKLTLVSKEWPSTDIARNVAVWLSNPDRFLRLESMPLPVAGRSRVLFIPNTPGLQEALAAEAALQRPAVLSASTMGRNRSYAIGKVTSLLQALERCANDRVRAWGFDPAEQRAASVPTPIGKPASWLKGEDFPDDLLRQHKTGGVNARLDIDTTGRVVACHDDELGGAKEFEALTCRLLIERGRYQPARSTSGKPVASYSLLSILWLFPSTLTQSSPP